ncbi:hypothetical protein [Myceligenerans cantabricum]
MNRAVKLATTLFASTVLASMAVVGAAAPATARAYASSVQVAPENAPLLESFGMDQRNGGPLYLRGTGLAPDTDYRINARHLDSDATVFPEGAEPVVTTDADGYFDARPDSPFSMTTSGFYRAFVVAPDDTVIEADRTVLFDVFGMPTVSWFEIDGGWLPDPDTVLRGSSYDVIAGAFPDGVLVEYEVRDPSGQVVESGTENSGEAGAVYHQFTTGPNTALGLWTWEYRYGELVATSKITVVCG